MTHVDPKVYVNIPLGSYSATVQEIAEAEGKFGPQFRWTFDLGEVEDVDGNLEDRTLVGYTSQALTPKSKLWTWTAALGVDPSLGLDTEDLIGKRVILDVTLEPRRDGDGEWNAIHQLRRPKAKPNNKPVHVAEEDDFDDGMPAL